METKSSTILLKNLALEVNNLLSEYIELHDKVLKGSGTFWSLFKKVDFEGIFNNCCKLQSRFEVEKEKLSTFKSENEQDFTENEKLYLNQLVSFFNKLLITVKLLVEKQNLLYQRSQKEKISWKQYKEVENQYGNSIEDYLIEGGKLNNLNALIFH